MLVSFLFHRSFRSMNLCNEAFKYTKIIQIELSELQNQNEISQLRVVFVLFFLLNFFQKKQLVLFLFICIYKQKAFCVYMYKYQYIHICQIKKNIETNLEGIYYGLNNL